MQFSIGRPKSIGALTLFGVLPQRRTFGRATNFYDLLFQPIMV